jgi:hypothetical protein
VALESEALMEGRVGHLILGVWLCLLAPVLPIQTRTSISAENSTGSVGVTDVCDKAEGGGEGEGS